MYPTHHRWSDLESLPYGNRMRRSKHKQRKEWKRCGRRDQTGRLRAPQFPLAPQQDRQGSGEINPSRTIRSQPTQRPSGREPILTPPAVPILPRRHRQVATQRFPPPSRSRWNWLAVFLCRPLCFQMREKASRQQSSPLNSKSPIRLWRRWTARSPSPGQPTAMKPQVKPTMILLQVRTSCIAPFMAIKLTTTRPCRRRWKPGRATEKNDKAIPGGTTAVSSDLCKKWVQTTYQPSILMPRGGISLHHLRDFVPGRDHPG
jgi:hypothetical protein